MLLVTPIATEIHHQLIETNHVALHVAQAGPAEGPLVILLHGFPEFWYGWRHQIPALAGAGFRVWAPDQRGYNLSEKPAGLEAYALDQLALDVVGLIDAAGVDKAFVAGHDWGAMVAWWTAIKYPERLHKLAILNVPHPLVMMRNVRENPQQMLKSWYVGFFQIPWLPETLLTLGDAQFGIRVLLETSNRGSFTDADIPHYVRAWKQPGAMTAMLNWYRSLVLHPPPPLYQPRVRVPTLILWGVRDIALTEVMAKQSLDYCDDGRLELFPEATHWVQHDERDAVNARLIAFFSDQPVSTAGAAPEEPPKDAHEPGAEPPSPPAV